jgi:hypothetical protein
VLRLGPAISRIIGIIVSMAKRTTAPCARRYKSKLDVRFQ